MTRLKQSAAFSGSPFISKSLAFSKSSLISPFLLSFFSLRQLATARLISVKKLAMIEMMTPRTKEAAT
ncbi:MAG: hypothetical protein A4E57_00533 [Syntrophorhabdaceae bacterium PtaU1.Bin034]|nr:MAG: hypothetical protein A4E57_00533 [Syntrophorhabdaceae bacterium PtaU1.Bin034]